MPARGGSVDAQGNYHQKPTGFPKCFPLAFVFILLGFTLCTLTNVEADPITAVLHARWCPDLTVQNPQNQCVTGGTVAGGVTFHLILNFQAPVISPGCQYIKAVEQTSLHTPNQIYVENPTGTGYSVTDPAYLSACSSPPTAYSQAVIYATLPLQTFACHNVDYYVEASYCYVRVVPPSPGQPGPRYERVGPITISITVAFNNLTVNSEPKILKWDPDVSANCDTTLTYSLACAQKKKCKVTLNIYSTANGHVYQKIYDGDEKLLCPGDYTFTWDGTTNQQGYPPGGTAPKGLYTYDIISEGPSPYDRDKMRTNYLTIERAVDENNQPIFEAEYYGYDEKDTPDDETDDEHQYFIRWYVLKDSESVDASSGEVWLYDPDLSKVGSWNLGALECLEHGAIDGLDASAQGVKHGLLVAVPLSWMDKVGDYVFVLHMKDDHAGKYKHHQVKPALELNSKEQAIQFDLDIADGQFGKIVSDKKEETEGAFTVANLNDTNSNGTVDKGEHPVLGEKDLMKLVIRVGKSGDGGEAWLEATSGAELIRLWETSDKTGDMILLPYKMDIPAGLRNFYWKKFWVEGLEKSSQLRDVKLKMEYKGRTDRVCATLVWAGVLEDTDVKHDRADVNWPDMTDPPKYLVDFYGGFGLRPITAETGVVNAIGFRYTVLPAGIQKIARVKFDITRQKESRVWQDDRLVQSRSFPASDEQPNDDPPEQGDESVAPTDSGTMFSYDAPGVVSSDTRGANLLVFRANFYEFVRVRFDAIKPSGNGVNGSRCSAKKPWHVRHRLQNQGGLWVRTTGDENETDANDIATGHIEIGDAP